jgi:hypothetical protein
MVAQALAETSAIIVKIMLTFVGAAFFCLLSLLTHGRIGPATRVSLAQMPLQNGWKGGYPGVPPCRTVHLMNWRGELRALWNMHPETRTGACT